MNPPTRSDNILYRNLKEGDKTAFDAIFNKFYPALCAYAARYVRLEDAENVVQDVMLWLWEHRGEAEITGALDAYLFRAVKNRALTLINRGAIREKVFNAIEKSMHDRFDAPDFYTVNDLTARLEDALAQLPPTYREAFELHRFHDKSYKEIADALGVSPKTVDYRIQQALKRLRVVLKDFLPIMNFILY